MAVQALYLCVFGANKGHAHTWAVVASAPTHPFHTPGDVAVCCCPRRLLNSAIMAGGVARLSSSDGDAGRGGVLGCSRVGDDDAGLTGLLGGRITVSVCPVADDV